jgi:hypothetical protein
MLFVMEDVLRAKLFYENLEMLKLFAILKKLN